MANPRTPTALRKLAGNPSKRPYNEAEPEYKVAGTLAPDWLTGEGLKQWQKLAAAMSANNMLNVGNYDTLATYCDLMGHYIQQRKEGQEPCLKTFAALRLMAKEFGFTPSSQAGVIAPEKKHNDDRESYFN